jgi:hypothetical protein
VITASHLSVGSSWFDGLQITSEPDGVTVMAGPIIDDAALHGVLVRSETSAYR